ncbi:hypothetical protein ACFLU5_07270 [Bacteroidota bacterium]
MTKIVDRRIWLSWIDFIQICPPFENLHDNPDFKALAKRAQDGKAAIRAQVQEMIESGEIDLSR